MNHHTTTTTTLSNNGNNFNDSLARLYATAKQLDTVTSLDCPTDTAEEEEGHDAPQQHHHFSSDTYPVVRRERSVSDTELFQYHKTTLTVPVVEMHPPDQHRPDSTASTRDTTTTTMMVDDNDDDDMDEIIRASTSSSNISNSGLLHPKQRVRSASCGSGATAITNKNNNSNVTAVVSLSPSHYCETIVEEEL